MAVVREETGGRTAGAQGPDRGITRRLAGYVAGLRFEDLPAAVVDKAVQHVRDGLGNQIAASAVSEPARRVVALLREWGGRPEATVVGFGDRLPLPHAVLANAMMGHGVELDDAHGRALTKAGSSLVPAVIAVGALLGRSGAEAVAALVAGYDVAIRIGTAVNPSHRRRGYHTSGTAGTFGVAAATARLLRLDEEATACALGLAGIQAAGIQGFLDDPCMAKPFSPGKAGFNGVLAGVLAGRGFTGPRTIIESREGFLRAYADEWDESALTAGLGTDFRLMEVGFKPHAACRYAHGPIDCAQEIHARIRPRHEEVAAVTVWMSELAIRQSGRSEVPNLNSAMGSTPFGVALALTQGRNGLAEYRRGFEDARNHRLASRVRLVADPVIGEMGRAARVRVELRDGRAEEASVPGPKGEMDRPLSEAELEAKFVGLAGSVLPDAQVEELRRLLADLPGLASVDAIPPLTVSPDPEGPRQRA